MSQLDCLGIETVRAGVPVRSEVSEVRVEDGLEDGDGDAGKVQALGGADRGSGIASGGVVNFLAAFAGDQTAGDEDEAGEETGGAVGDVACVWLLFLVDVFLWSADQNYKNKY